MLMTVEQGIIEKVPYAFLATVAIFTKWKKRSQFPAKSPGPLASAA